MRDWLSRNTPETRGEKIAIGVLVAVIGLALAAVFGAFSGGSSKPTPPTVIEPPAPPTTSTETTSTPSSVSTPTISPQQQIDAAVATCRKFAYGPETSGKNNTVVHAAGPLGVGTYNRQLDTNPVPADSTSATAFFGVCPNRDGDLKLDVIPTPTSCNAMTVNIDDASGKLLRQSSPDPPSGHGDPTHWQVEAGKRYLIEINSCRDIEYSLQIDPSSPLS